MAIRPCLLVTVYRNTQQYNVGEAHLGQRRDGGYEAGHALAYEVGVEVGLLEGGHVGQEEDGAGAVHQRQQEHGHEEAGGALLAADGGSDKSSN